MIVVDTNVVVKLVLRSAESETVERLFATEPNWLGPRLVRSEVMSVLSKEGPKANMGPADALEAFEIAMEAFEDASLEPSTARVLHLAMRSGRSSYDCEFVAVAEELGCVLVTYDQPVLKSFPTIATTPERLLGDRA